MQNAVTVVVLEAFHWSHSPSGIQYIHPSIFVQALWEGGWCTGSALLQPHSGVINNTLVSWSSFLLLLLLLLFSPFPCLLQLVEVERTQRPGNYVRCCNIKRKTNCGPDVCTNPQIVSHQTDSSEPAIYCICKPMRANSQLVWQRGSRQTSEGCVLWCAYWHRGGGGGGGGRIIQCKLCMCEYRPPRPPAE